MILKKSLFLNLNSLEGESTRSSETWLSAYKTPRYSPEDHNPSINDLFAINFTYDCCKFSIGASENCLVEYHSMTKHTEG
jgi:hypothetical protein